MSVVRSVSQGTRATLQMHNTLNRLMHRVQSRHFSSKPAGSEVLADWTTAETSFTIVRPLEAADIAQAGQDTTLGHNVTVHGHPRLQASARLTNLPQVSRDAGNLTLPALLRDHPEVVQPFTFSSSRSGEPGLSVLEFVNVEDHTVVTADDPLRVTIATPLAADEQLLPLGFDGEFFLPLGRVTRTADGVAITLERLPAPTSQGTRDLKGSIKILFQKLVGQRLGLRYDYPLLRVADIATDGTLTSSTAGDLAAVRTRVARAKCILLYIHGIIGDTRGMAASARTAWSCRHRLPRLLTTMISRSIMKISIRLLKRTRGNCKNASRLSGSLPTTARPCISWRTRWGAWCRGGLLSGKGAIKWSNTW